MPTKAARACKAPYCPNLTKDPSGFCDAHAHLRVSIVRGEERRPGAARRGYGSEWRKIRAEVLIAFGIPRCDWALYDIDHSPRYDPNVDPDHRHYTLTPRLHGDHSRKTIREDGGLGHAKRGEHRIFGGSKDIPQRFRNFSHIQNSRGGV